jgi:hypothetical protein
MSYLTQKHSENVRDRGVITIISESVYCDSSEYGVRNVADLTSYSCFKSRDEPHQWTCWDFGEKRIRPTHYTIKVSNLKSWVVESSLDSKAWTGIDRKTDLQDFKSSSRHDWTASFAVSDSAECRFIRLTQIENHSPAMHRQQSVYALEVFGTLE